MCFVPADLAPCGVIFDFIAETIRPDHPRGDDVFGLALGTNGTAAQCRRQLVEASQNAEGFTWVRCNGEPATGVTCIPTANSDLVPSIWEG